MTKILDCNSLKPGDCLSEVSYYRVKSVQNGHVESQHVGSGKTVKLSREYVEKLLSSAEQYDKEITLGKEDKYWTANQKLPSGVNVGDLKQQGIRSVWQNISNKVFTVCFIKQSKTLSTREFTRRKQEQLDKALAEIDIAKKSRKSISAAAHKALKEIQENPVVREIPGETRVLRGYKVQFNSRDGKYKVYDMDKQEGRLVNINTIKWLVYDGVKYILE